MDYFRHSTSPGWIEVITGCMYSGKSEELIRQLRRAEFAKQQLQVFKPKIDDRYSLDSVASHNRDEFPSMVIEHPYEILHHVSRTTQVVGIDEGQFFDDSIVQVVQKLADEGKRVLVAGLDTDWQGKPFGPMPQLMAVAEIVKKQYAVCMTCGDPATRTQRLVEGKESILVGSHGSYEARCRKHFDSELSLRLNTPESQPTKEQIQPSETANT